MDEEREAWYSWVIVGCSNCPGEYWVACRFDRMSDQVQATLDRIDLELCERWSVGHGQTVGRGTRPMHPVYINQRTFNVSAEN